VCITRFSLIHSVLDAVVRNRLQAVHVMLAAAAVNVCSTVWCSFMYVLQVVVHYTYYYDCYVFD
jgi:hypothetical protein